MRLKWKLPPTSPYINLVRRTYSHVCCAAKKHLFISWIFFHFCTRCIVLTNIDDYQHPRCMFKTHILKVKTLPLGKCWHTSMVAFQKNVCLFFSEQKIFKGMQVFCSKLLMKKVPSMDLVVHRKTCIPLLRQSRPNICSSSLHQ